MVALEYIMTQLNNIKECDVVTLMSFNSVKFVAENEFNNIKEKVIFTAI